MLSAAVRRLFLHAVLCAALTLPTAAQSPQIKAESYILLDAETGTVLAENNADLRLPPASLTKIMTAHLTFQALADGVLEMQQPVTISENAWASKVVGSKMFIEVNTQVRVADLLRGVIVQSGNDASIALAEAVAGDEQLFAQAMNTTAAELNLNNSHFANSTGLPAKEQYSSARDMALLIRETVRAFPEYYRMYDEREFTYNNIRQSNRNRLLETFPGADGVKTGYTEAAGYCLAASALRDGRRLIAVVMKTPSARARVRETSKLLTFGFNNFHNTRLFSRADTRTLPVWGGAADSVQIQPAKDGIYTLPRRRDATVQYEPTVPVLAPVAAGDIVGELRVVIDGEVHDRTEVVAVTAVAAGSWWKRALDYFKINWLGHGKLSDAVFSQW